MSDQNPLTMLCLASYEKGEAFLRECKGQGCRVILITVEKLRDANWPREAIDEVFYLPTGYSRDDVIKGVSYLARNQAIDRIVPLDTVDRIIAIGSDRMMAAVAAARHRELAPYLKRDHVALASINSPMQCMMKEICGQCLQTHRDPVTGQETVVFTCSNQDQAMGRYAHA